MEHLVNNRIIVKGRLSRDTSTMYAGAHGHPRPQNTKKNHPQAGGARTFNKLGSSETVSHYTLSAWLLSPLIFLTPPSYFCLSLSFAPLSFTSPFLSSRANLFEVPHYLHL